MQFCENTYYHLYNRTNNEELLFRSEENYLYFLKKYRYYLDEYFETIGYCLMPTHFHFLVRVKEYKDEPHLEGGVHLELSQLISKKIGILLSSYTKAINIRYDRHGSLFQEHSKAKQVTSDNYLITLLTYIHQNPIRSGLVEKVNDWLFSSYQDYIDLRNGTLPSKGIILSMIKKNELKEITEKRIIYKKDIKD
jgi:REP element-mobilizing transposase RayT